MTPTELHFDPVLMIQSSYFLPKLCLKTRPLSKWWVSSPVFRTTWKLFLCLKMSLRCASPHTWKQFLPPT